MTPIDPDDISAARKQRRDDLWDHLVSEPAGITVDDMIATHGWSHHQANVAIHDLRAFLGDTDTVNLVCEPQGGGERWLYQLVGSLDGVRGWVANRVGDTETRLRTMESMMHSIVQGTSGRTTEGRKARLMDKALTRLVEDLDDLALNGPMP